MLPQCPYDIPWSPHCPRNIPRPSSGPCVSPPSPAASPPGWIAQGWPQIFKDIAAPLTAPPGTGSPGQSPAQSPSDGVKPSGPWLPLVLLQLPIPCSSSVNGTGLSRAQKTKELGSWRELSARSAWAMVSSARRPSSRHSCSTSPNCLYASSMMELRRGGRGSQKPASTQG